MVPSLCVHRQFESIVAFVCSDLQPSAFVQCLIGIDGWNSGVWWPNFWASGRSEEAESMVLLVCAKGRAK